MARAVAPTELPPEPEWALGWRRSLRRGSMFHLIDALGATRCRRSRVLERVDSEAMRDLGHAQYWGVCPRCLRKATK